jgi:thiol-disulfide isomerase/thioredoxin
MYMRFSVVMFVAAFAAFALPAGAAAPPPEVSIKDIDDLPMPLPYPYDKSADARADVDAAFARTQHNGKRVLIDLGGNWCADCRILAGIMQLPEVKAFIERHYEIVAVDVGHYDRNMDIPESFGIDRFVLPTIIVADPDGTPVNVSDASELSDARHMTPQGIANWLARWAEPED